MRRCYLFDIDGTLADCSHRLHHIQKEPEDWDAFFAACAGDKPIRVICDLARHLGLDHYILLVTGRAENNRDATVEWLQRHNIPYAGLYMRAAGDSRHDDIVKSELLDAILRDRWQPIMAFEDRDRVVAMWRSRGIPCAQVAEGNY